MPYTVTWSEFVARKNADLFEFERSASGRPSSCDFVAGPLSWAAHEFKDFDRLAEHSSPSVRRLEFVDNVFGAVSFIAVLTGPTSVEITDFTVDLDYWTDEETPEDEGGGSG